MVKIDLARTIAEKLEITQKEADDFLTTFMEVVGNSLEKGEKIQLSGFGIFGLRYVPEHKGRNPKTAEHLVVPACFYPVFKAGKGLKDRVAKCEKMQPANEELETDDAHTESPSSSSPRPGRKKKSSSSPEESNV